ncbi:MAG: hypothetical protein E7Z84_04695 [Methanosphaera stadtmanae]|jgi:glucan-binding YG repeat protein|nr:hypothetical protein [Methanosphaera stadtmanae]
MKLNDIFLAIGIIIMGSLLVFVVYDDTMGNPYQMYMLKGMEINISGESNISDNDTMLVHSEIVNNTINIELIPKTKTTSIQNTNTNTITQTSNTRTSSVQSTNTQNNNPNNNIKTSSQISKSQSSSNNYNNKEIRQNEPNTQKKQDSLPIKSRF